MSRRAQSDNRASERRSPAQLLRAFEIAAREHPHPNPRVGAVITDSSGTIVGEGAHAAAGAPHAEILALRQAASAARGGTAYVTLEPCSHVGRTPPCTEALIDAGLANVVVAVGDPDPRVAGSGIARLREAGVRVTADVDPATGESLDPGYFHHRRTGRPLVTLKVAATLDGQIAAADRTSQWLTSREARRDAHRLRARSDAVVVGAGTLRSDDPRLDARADGYAGPQPLAVIIAGETPLPENASVYDRGPVIYRTRAHGDEPAGAELVTVPGVEQADLAAAIKDLGGRGVLDALVEGGPRLAGELLRTDLVDRVVVYLAAKLAGGSGLPMFGGTWRTLTDAIDMDILDVTTLGPDVRITAAIRGRG